MSEVVTKLAEASMSEIVSKVAQAMADATKDYGPQAVDLAMMAYRVMAIQSVLMWLVMFLSWLSIPFILKKVWKVTEDWNSLEKNEARAYPFIGGGILGLFLSIALLVKFSVVDWIAAFGYPELLIATKALIAAGLM